MKIDIFSLHPEDLIKKSYKIPSWKKWDTIPVIDDHNSLIGLINYKTIETNLQGDSIAADSSNSEISQAGNAISEVFQIGITATVSALMLPNVGNKKNEL